MREPVKEPTRRLLRTALQTVFALLAALPLLADEPGVADVPALAAMVAVAAALSRLMSAPAVERVLPSWLRREG
ncbi:hypothetical protein [Streptomyces sp. H27-D2]|uniref:hypothetical protein n=1 Tax=Streptomyces sp. H27-D2 TaxID=3046304 RepID=UPI002DB9FB2B|nr:hypothetical protein [Streptomyces sp. H27-D2]MEC4016397.1 hypothetical protein [Streptomyces sp. H27-D2]